MRQRAILVVLALLATAQPAGAQLPSDRFCIANESTILLRIWVHGVSNEGRDFFNRSFLPANAVHCELQPNPQSVGWTIYHHDGRDWLAFSAAACSDRAPRRGVGVVLLGGLGRRVIPPRRVG